MSALNLVFSVFLVTSIWKGGRDLCSSVHKQCIGFKSTLRKQSNILSTGFYTCCYGTVLFWNDTLFFFQTKIILIYFSSKNEIIDNCSTELESHTKPLISNYFSSKFEILYTFQTSSQFQHMVRYLFSYNYSAVGTISL